MGEAAVMILKGGNMAETTQNQKTMQVGDCLTWNELHDMGYLHIKGNLTGDIFYGQNCWIITFHQLRKFRVLRIVPIASS